MVNVPPPSPPYRGPARFHGGAQPDPYRVVIHCTVSPTVEGGAEAIARYFRVTVTRPSSAHYVVDPGAVRQVVFDHVEAYHAPPNRGSIGIELCDPVAGPATRWGDRAHSRMLHRAARLTARLTLAYPTIPVVKRDGAGLRAHNGEGICGHADVRDAWHQTDHFDPGPGFPWPRFMRLVRYYRGLIKTRFAVTNAGRQIVGRRSGNAARDPDPKK